MKLTQQQKLEWAEKLRAPQNLPFTAPEGYLDCLEKVEQKTLEIPTGVGDSKCYLVTPKTGAKNDLLYINIHGGGFVQPHNVWDGALCAVMALEFSCPVLDIDYRLAPEYPFPTQIHECYGVVQWAMEHAAELGASPDKVILGGNSAGGTLTANAIMVVGEKGGKVPAMAVLIYPAASPLLTKRLPEDLESMDLKDLEARGAFYNEMYAGDVAGAADSPYIYLEKASEAQMSLFPDSVVVTGGLDPLRFSGERLAGLMAASGSTITLRRFLHSDHGFYQRCMGEWQEARAMVFGAIKEKFGV